MKQICRNTLTIQVLKKQEDIYYVNETVQYEIISHSTAQKSLKLRLYFSNPEILTSTNVCYLFI